MTTLLLLLILWELGRMSDSGSHLSPICRASAIWANCLRDNPGPDQASLVHVQKRIMSMQLSLAAS